ncbi:g2308 [Coccomyxa elongata]
MKAALDASYVVERSVHQLVKYLFLSFILALALTHTSKCLWLNIPLALATVAGLYWLSLQVDIRARSIGGSAFQKRGRKQSEEDMADAASFTASVPPPVSNKSDNKWREQVASPVVEHAWETLCGSIIQEFVYDTWYSVLTPDREFPREIRRILNTAFGELAGRARRADVRKMLLGDVSALFMEQIMLYRDTRDSILAGLDHEAWRVMPLESRERALQAEMKADCNLHPALYPPSADSSAILGHYKVMKQVSEGLVAFMLERHDHAKPILRSVARELLSSCVLRSLMSFFTPYTANKLILSLLREKVERKPLGVEELAAAAAAAASTAEPPIKAQQSGIEQRARQSAAAEDSHAASARAAKQAQRERGAAALQRSRSEASPSGRSERLPSPRTSSPSRKERRNWSPGKRDKFKAPPSPMQPHKATSNAAATAALSQRTNGGAVTSSSVQGSDGSDEWEDVYQSRRAAGPGGMHHSRSASMSQADGPGSALGQDGDGGWLGAGDLVGRREANGTAGAAVFADSNFTPDPNIPEGPQAPGAERYCFIGQPHARVVAAELHSEGSKDVVIYKIRVADGSGEWTVSRRFRNFETLHRALRELAAYRLRLPAKKIFSQQHSVEFVEDRRQQLDAYLQALLANPAVAGCKEVWEFLSAWSELYGLSTEGGFLRSVSAKIQGANTSMRRAVGDMVEEMDMTRRKSIARLRNSRGDGADASVDGQPLHRASRSFSRDLEKLRHLGVRKRGNGTGQEPITQPPPFQAMNSADSGSARMLRISGASDLINGAGQLLAAGARQVHGVRQVLQGSQGAEDRAMRLPSANSMPAPSFSVDDIPMEEFHGELLHYSRPASLQSHGTSPTETPLSATPASSRGHSPTRPIPELHRGEQPQRRTEETPPTEQLPSSASAQDSASGAKSTRFRQETMQKANSMEAPGSEQPDEAALARSAPSIASPRPAPIPASERLTPQSQPRRPPQRGDTGHISFGGIVQSPSVATVAANIEAVGPPSGVRFPDLMRDDPDMADWEEAAGISAPLYDIVDTLFELQSRGFFRRQVFGVARQVLSLVAGGAIDEWLLSNMRALRQEHTLARLLCHLQRQLWPGGAWFQSLPENQHPPPSGKPVQRWVMTAENFMEPHGEPPIDEDEIREAVWELLFARAPPALVRVVGKQVYHSGMADLFEMLQSRTFMQQLGYGLLKIGLVNLFPELKLLFRRIERGALETAAGHAAPGPPGGSGAASATSGSEQAQSAPTSFKSAKESRKQ